MRHSTCSRIASLAGSLLIMLPLDGWPLDDSKDPRRRRPTRTRRRRDRAHGRKSQGKDAKQVPEINLLEAMRNGLVSVKAEGTGDGRMTLSVTNHSKRQLRVVLPPGIIAQSATGQFGGMGGMGGMGGGMGGMGGGWVVWAVHGRWHGWWHGRRYGRRR